MRRDHGARYTRRTCKKEMILQRNARSSEWFLDMRYKIFQIVCVLIFFLSFGYFFGHEYWSFHETETEKKIFEQQAYKQGQDFSLEEINEPSQEIELWETPSVELLKKLVREIDEANQEVLVEVYIFTERDLRDALIRAHKR